MPYGGAIHSTVQADLAQVDVDAIVQGIAGEDARTLADLESRLRSVEDMLFGTSSSVLGSMESSLRYGLLDAFGADPYLERIESDLNYYNNDPVGYQPMLQSINNLLQGMILSSLYDLNTYQPWMQKIDQSLEINLSDWDLGLPWLSRLFDEVAALNAVLADVHDPAQHALRTV